MIVAPEITIDCDICLVCLWVDYYVDRECPHIHWNNLSLPLINGFHLIMMTLSNGIIFRVTGPMCVEFTGHRWIPLTKDSDAELWCFLHLRLNAPLRIKQSRCRRFETQSRSLWRHCNVAACPHSAVYLYIVTKEQFGHIATFYPHGWVNAICPECAYLKVWVQKQHVWIIFFTYVYDELPPRRVRMFRPPLCWPSFPLVNWI